jgi:hypothetical protein
MRRLGILLHLMNFCGNTEQLHWVEEMQMEGIHLDMKHFREQKPSQDIFPTLRQSAYSPIQIYASNVGLVKDLENASDWEIDHCYGGLMMSPISRHQMLQINDSRIAKAIFSLHPHQHLNPNGDK